LVAQEEEERAMNGTPRALLAVLGLAITAGAGAQDGPVRILVGFPPGGTSDVIARLIVDRMRTSLGTTVVVENKPGASGQIAAEALKNAAPDGRTLMISPIAVTVFAPLTHTKLRYDPIKDFAPVSHVGITPTTLNVHPSVPAKDVKELIAIAGARPGALNYGSGGAGSGSHLGAELFRYLTKVDITHVPYKGVGPAVADTVAGQVHMTFTTLPSAVSFVRSGQLRSLATAGTQRAPQLPDVPTFVESGVPEYLMDYWYCLVAPAATPKEIQNRIGGAVREVMRMPDVAASLDKSGFVPLNMTADEFVAYLRKDSERWAAVVRAAGIKAE
jgi:tripartite-type tricarboxylate transporter receptor subunit TctC